MVFSFSASAETPPTDPYAHIQYCTQKQNGCGASCCLKLGKTASQMSDTDARNCDECETICPRGTCGLPGDDVYVCHMGSVGYHDDYQNCLRTCSAAYGCPISSGDISTCGVGGCQLGEDSYNCPQDCGPPTTPTPSTAISAQKCSFSCPAQTNYLDSVTSTCRRFSCDLNLCHTYEVQFISRADPAVGIRECGCKPFATFNVTFVNDNFVKILATDCYGQPLVGKRFKIRAEAGDELGDKSQLSRGDCALSKCSITLVTNASGEAVSIIPLDPTKLDTVNGEINDTVIGKLYLGGDLDDPNVDLFAGGSGKVGYQSEVISVNATYLARIIATTGVARLRNSTGGEHVLQAGEKLGYGNTLVLSLEEKRPTSMLNYYGDAAEVSLLPSGRLIPDNSQVIVEYIDGTRVQIASDGTSKGQVEMQLVYVNGDDLVWNGVLGTGTKMATKFLIKKGVSYLIATGAIAAVGFPWTVSTVVAFVTVEGTSWVMTPPSPGYQMYLVHSTVGIVPIDNSSYYVYVKEGNVTGYSENFSVPGSNVTTGFRIKIGSDGNQQGAAEPITNDEFDLAVFGAVDGGGIKPPEPTLVPNNTPVPIATPTPESTPEPTPTPESNQPPDLCQGMALLGLIASMGIFGAYSIRKD